MRLLARLFDESEFLSPHGLRALSAYHRQHPCEIDVEGVRATIDYEPAESTTSMFGGNSNWRGPVWFPVNCQAYSAAVRAGQPGRQVAEFRAMVNALHRAGLEVLLDVVCNHTAKGNELGLTLC